MPQPILNEGIDELVWTADGTRYYSPSSNQVNLQNSGPYKYMSLFIIILQCAVRLPSLCTRSDCAAPSTDPAHSNA